MPKERRPGLQPSVGERPHVVPSDGGVEEPSRPTRRTGPLDPRLLRYATATRRFLVASVVSGALTALLVIAQAWLLADTISGAFVHHRSLATLRLPLGLLLA